MCRRRKKPVPAEPARELTTLERLRLPDEEAAGLSGDPYKVSATKNGRLSVGGKLLVGDELRRKLFGGPMG